ncbi:MAG TPA: exonuclease SbcCD subunit D [Clostridiaceae bacterium]|jgi:exonuclease SbcD|nr:exonuclease SbcCD subunit D [Clostridiaceae bacterium]
MRFIHLADLHIGKRINEFSLLEDQTYILDKIVEITEKETADAVIIAGDLYDKSVPPGEAVPVLDDFLTRLSEMDKTVFIISGNHDSSERLSFGSRLLKKSNIHIISTFEGSLSKTVLKDDYGNINIFALPFVRPARVQKYFPDKTISSYEDAIVEIINDAKDKRILVPNERNILICHQFVTGTSSPILSDSESTIVGTLENISYEIFDDFDYVALGHLHCPQSVGRDTIRYAGSPLKYSFSEVNHKKSVTIVDIDKSMVTLKVSPLNPTRDMRKIKGKLENLISPEVCEEVCNDFIHATLTDENDIYEPLATLRAYYPYILHMEHIKESEFSNENNNISVYDRINKNPVELFKEFYEEIKQEEFDVQKQKLLEKLLKEEGLEEFCHDTH